MASKLPYPDPRSLSRDTKLLLAARPARNMYRMLAHAPSALPGVLELTRALLHDGRMPPTLRELAILRVGHLCSSSYQVHQHRKIAMAVGLDRARIDGTALDSDARTDAVYSGKEVLVLRFVEQVLRQTRADPDLRNRIVEALGLEQTMELLVLVGTYAMLARVLENAGVEVEDGSGPPLSEVAQIYSQQAAGWQPRSVVAEPAATARESPPAPSRRSKPTRRSSAAPNAAVSPPPPSRRR